jgi:transposase
MAADYGRNLYRDYEAEIKKNEELSVLVAALKEEIRSLVRNHAADIAEMRAEHRKEIRALKEEHAAVAAEFTARTANLESEAEKLKSQNNKNSSNSSKPPSGDGFKKKIPNGREKTGRSPGGQKGHKGNIPVLCDAPAEVIDHNAKHCDCGGEVIYDKAPVRKQEIDLEITVHVTEHRAGVGHCAKCGKKIANAFPSHIRNTVTIGNGVKSAATMLVSECCVPVEKAREFLFEATGGLLRIADSSIVNFAKELKDKISPSLESIEKRLICEPVNHKDETGIRINGKMHWLHVNSTKNFSRFSVHKKRGCEADTDIGILTGYSGILMHDHMKGLYKFKCTHAECNGHVLRYLQGIIEGEKKYRLFAARMHKLLKSACHERNKLIAGGKTRFPAGKKKSIRTKYDAVLRDWLGFLEEEEKKRAGKSKYKSEGEKLPVRLCKFKEQHLLFLENFDVPFTNTQAERDFRCIKTKTKVSGGFRSDDGGKAYADITSYVSTLRKQHLNIFQGLRLAFSGCPVMF